MQMFKWLSVSIFLTDSYQISTSQAGFIQQIQQFHTHSSSNPRVSAHERVPQLRGAGTLTLHTQNPGRAVSPRTPTLNIRICSPSEAASEMPPLPLLSTTNNQKFNIRNQTFTRKRVPRPRDPPLLDRKTR